MIEATCRARITAGPHLHRDADDLDRQPGEMSIAELAARLMVKPDVVYYWAARGYLPTRRGKSGRHWIAFTSELEQDCRARITASYKLPAHVKAAHRTEGIAV